MSGCSLRKVIPSQSRKHSPPRVFRAVRCRNVLNPRLVRRILPICPVRAQSVMPTEVRPALATLEDKAFSHPDWLFEIKWDGERALTWITDGDLQIRSRSGRDITLEYPDLKPLVKDLNARQAIVDGEIVVLNEEGRPDFKKVQKRFGVENPSAALRREFPVTYYAFDLLFCDGYDLRNSPLTERKALLQKLLSGSAVARFSDHYIEHGVQLFELARERGLEGMIAKRLDSRYCEGRTRAWIKFKIVHDLDVVIGGWTAPRNSRDHFGALLMGLYRAGQLHCVGSVGSGFTNETLAEIIGQLRPLETAKCPFVTTPKVKERVKWINPQLVARVHYSQWTEDLRLRAPVFLGLLDDHDPQSCTFEDEVPRTRDSGHRGARHETWCFRVNRRGRHGARPRAGTVPRARRDDIHRARRKKTRLDQSEQDLLSRIRFQKARPARLLPSNRKIHSPVLERSSDGLEALSQWHSRRILLPKGSAAFAAGLAAYGIDRLEDSPWQNEIFHRRHHRCASVPHKLRLY